MFIKSFNHVHGTHFVVNGTPHSKAYWPWGFPTDCPDHHTLFKAVYDQLIEHWVPSYKGFAVEKAPLAPDSTAPSGPTEGGIVARDPVAEWLEQRKKRKADQMG